MRKTSFMQKTSKADLIEQLRQEVMALKESPLYEYRTTNGYFPVIGEGSYDAEIMFVGEAPGKKEAETGKPFCGASGRVLDKLLASVGVAREDVYITNIVNDRPPENRDPTPEEIALYAPFLERQIEIIKPRVLATLGRFSMNHVLGMFGFPPALISKAHGSVYTIAGTGQSGVIIPLYHPAAALYNGSMMTTLEEDFKKIALHGIS